MNLTLTNTLLLFGIFQSVVMIFLILTTRNWRQIQNKILLSILVVLGVSLLPMFLGNSGVVEQNSNLLFLPAHLSIFIFPLLFLYFKSIFVLNFKIDKSSVLHLVIPIIFWVYLVIIWFNTLGEPIAQKREVAISFYYFQIKTIHDIVLLLMVLMYTWLASQLMYNAKKERLSKDQEKFSKWLRYLLLFLVAGAILDITSLVIGEMYGYWKGSPLDELLGIPFVLLIKIYYSFIVYVISIIGYASYSEFKVNNYSTINSSVFDYSPKVIEAMEIRKMFLNPNLSLQVLAKELNTTSGVISTVINSGFKMSFNDFVNRYRVEEVKNKLQSENLNQFTLLALAQDSGFKSKTTFYRAFQKFTLQTPKSYIKMLHAKK
ncbi:helix-turn-helix domain-containing protein [Aquimarina algiphila]|uniref:helix-turn-helix domain-containing protein n=1 Tax=Aquimarina algiphila TaxID=2047982 RepID=UPI00232B766A|nr:AraC family transcriptional regulator [Aquimarina algiphila]